jgi:hypothetical protein
MEECCADAKDHGNFICLNKKRSLLHQPNPFLLRDREINQLIVRLDMLRKFLEGM